MAKGIDVNGQLRGKRGGMVYYRAYGEQISRAKATQVKNPKSAKQSVQRMVLAAASKLTAALRPIVDHSFEGTAIGNDSVFLFQSRAAKYLRGVAAVYLNDPTAVSAVANFPIKGAPIVGGAEGLFISQGRLGLNGVTFPGDSQLVLSLSSALAASITTQAEYIAELAKLGIAPGDQLTFVCLAQNTSIPVASMAYGDNDSYSNYVQVVRYSRVVFTPTLPEDFTGALIADGAFNPALISESLGLLPAVSADATGITFAFSGILETGYNMYLGTIIRSQKQENGKFYYSSAALLSDHDELDANDAYPVYVSYMDGATTIDVGQEKFLRHAVAAPFGEGE